MSELMNLHFSGHAGRQGILSLYVYTKISMGDPPTLKSPYRTGLRTPTPWLCQVCADLQVVDQDDGENSGKEHPERKRKLKKGLAGIKV